MLMYRMQLVAKERDRKTERKRTFINRLSRERQIHIKSIERRYKPRVAIVSDTSCLAGMTCIMGREI
jgi:hypothetical protein